MHQIGLTGRVFGCSATWAMALLVVAASVHGANVNLELRNLPLEACGGDILPVGLYFVSDNNSNQSIAGAEVILQWDSQQLGLLGKEDNGPYSWLGSFFPNDAQAEGLNAPFTGPEPFVPANDGNALYSVFGLFAPNPPAEATPDGLLVTTFQFVALGDGPVNLTIPASIGQFAETRVVDGIHPGVVITGTLPSVNTSVSCPPPQAAPQGSRRVLITPSGCPSGASLAILGDVNNSDVACVHQFAQANGVLYPVPTFQPAGAWGTQSVRGLVLRPETTYTVRVECGYGLVFGPSTGVSVTTGTWADLDSTGIIDVDDITLMLQAFTGFLLPEDLPYYDLMPCEPNNLLDLDDILAMLDAFQGVPFDLLCPPPCP